MRSVKLVLDYDGTSFKGFAKQPTERTVQGCLEEALSSALGEKIRVFGASRTDSGVHALGQVVSFTTSSRIPAKKMPAALKGFLPPDIVVRSAEDAAPGFDPRRGAKKKLYAYMLAVRGTPTAVMKRHVWSLSFDPSVALMKKAARVLIGRHDFSSFALTSKEKKDPVKEIYSIKFKQGSAEDFFGELGVGCDSKIVRIEFSGNAFLHKMIRGMVGTLVEIGAGKSPPDAMKKILKKKARAAAGRTAPAAGLCLIKIDY